MAIGRNSQRSALKAWAASRSSPTPSCLYSKRAKRCVKGSRDECKRYAHLHEHCRLRAEACRRCGRACRGLLAAVRWVKIQSSPRRVGRPPDQHWRAAPQGRARGPITTHRVPRHSDCPATDSVRDSPAERDGACSQSSGGSIRANSASTASPRVNASSTQLRRVSSDGCPMPASLLLMITACGASSSYSKDTRPYLSSIPGWSAIFSR
jgi:hypothetical protein